MLAPEPRSLLMLLALALPVAAPSCRTDDRNVAPVTSPGPPHSPREQEDALHRAALHNRAGVPEALDVAVLGGGCFWGMQQLLRQLPGVSSTQVGYAGGSADNASYARVSSGNTLHAETVKIVFDPQKLPYERLLAWFFRIHDPTTPNRQGNDVGRRYRSVIFYQNAEQAVIAQTVKARAQDSGNFDAPITTEIVPAKEFYPAEQFHQDYLQKNPAGYTCHFVRPFDL